MRSLIPACGGIAAVLLASSLSAQVAFQESMTNWTHAGSTGWTDNFAMSTAKGGKVDRLNSSTVLNYSRSVTTLKKGHYVATVRLMKFKDKVGVAPLTLEVISSGKVSEQTIAFSQSTDHWIYTQTVAFSVAVDNAPAVFRLFNIDPKITKTNYYFDWFKIGKIPEGKVLKYQSMDYDYAPWTGAWLGSSTWFTNHLAEKSSAFGEVAQPKGVNWMEHKSYYGWNKTDPKHDMVLQPGTYTINWRVFVPASGLWPLDLIYNMGASGWVKRTWAIAEQKQGQWNLSPNISFTVTKPNTGLWFIFRNIQTGAKYGYKLDSFMVRRGAFDVSGTACKTSLGTASLSGSVPQIGETFTVSVSSAPLAAIFFIGGQALKLDMSAAGMTGCTLYTAPILFLPAAATKNVASLSLPLPRDTSLIGARWLEQAMVLDAKANKFGAALSDFGSALVQN